ncbi:MAG: heavy-metal-associated domain-containing protein [Flavobacteriales bacterium]|nr:heavy-metal-associated domain-containing protein [Flavobacteriales bacterium]
MYQKIAVALLLFVGLIACKNEKSTDENVEVQEQKELALKSISFEISGMTCEVGCARTIKKKLKATEGVQSVEVDFEAAKAIVGFDANILSTDDIVSVVEGVAGGGIYKVSNVMPYEGGKSGKCCGGKCECKGACAKDSTKCKKDSLGTHCCMKKCSKDSLQCKKMKTHCQKKDSVQ